MEELDGWDSNRTGCVERGKAFVLIQMAAGNGREFGAGEVERVLIFGDEWNMVRMWLTLRALAGVQSEKSPR